MTPSLVPNLLEIYRQVSWLFLFWTTDNFETKINHVDAWVWVFLLSISQDSDSIPEQILARHTDEKLANFDWIHSASIS